MGKLLNCIRNLFRPAWEDPYDWDNWYEDGGLEREPLKYYYEVLNIIPPNAAVLDVGCGNGRFLRIIKNKTSTLLGLDFSEEAVTKLRQEGFAAEHCDIGEQDLPLHAGAPWDFAVPLMVVEHMRYPYKILEQMARVSDRIIIAIPNSGFWFLRLRHLFGRCSGQCGDHIQFWSLLDFKDFLDFHGVHTIDRIAPVWGAGIKQILAKLCPNLFAIHLVLEIKSDRIINAKEKTRATIKKDEG